MRHFTRLAASAVVVGLAVAPASASAQQFLNVLTGGTSGVYYPLGVALAKIYGENIDGVKTQVQSTKASVENIKKPKPLVLRIKCNTFVPNALF